MEFISSSGPLLLLGLQAAALNMLNLVKKINTTHQNHIYIPFRNFAILLLFKDVRDNWGVNLIISVSVDKRTHTVESAKFSHWFDKYLLNYSLCQPLFWVLEDIAATQIETNYTNKFRMGQK